MHIIPMERDILIKKILYQSSHRGCKETDTLLGEFAAREIHHFTDTELGLFDQFLQENDWDIYSWLINATPLPKIYQTHLIERLKQSF